MEKKSKIKNRIFAGFLAFTLMGCKPMLVKGEEQLVQEETQVELIDMFKVDYDIAEPEYEGYEHKYVSEDGKEEKWYVSYLPEIDGLKRTDERVAVTPVDWDYAKDEEFKGDYNYLYYNNFDAGLLPLHPSIEREQGSNIILICDEIYSRTKTVTTISDEAREILINYGVYRASDMILLFDTMKEVFTEENKKGLSLLKPLFIDEEGLHVEVIGIPVDKIAYNHETMNGLLYYPEANTIKDDYFTTTQEEKQFVIKKVNQ